MIRLQVINAPQTPDICGPCGGRCCKGSPGFTIPQDWAGGDGELDVARIGAALSDGWVIEQWYDGMAVRPRSVREFSEYIDKTPESLYDKMFGDNSAGQCVLHSDSGCSLLADARPTQCRILVADPEPSVSKKHCRPQGEMFAMLGRDEDVFDLWKPYHSELLRAAEIASELRRAAAEEAAE